MHSKTIQQKSNEISNIKWNIFHCYKVWSLHPSQAKGKGQGWHKCRASARTHQRILIFSLLFLVQLTSFSSSFSSSSSKLTHQIDNVLENCIVISRGLDSSRTVIDNSTNPPLVGLLMSGSSPLMRIPTLPIGASCISELTSVFSLFSICLCVSSWSIFRLARPCLQFGVCFYVRLF